MTRPIATVVALVLVAGVAACGSKSALDSACNGYSDLLATTRSDPTHQGGRQVLLVHPDGTDAKVLTKDGVVAADPSFSPDGKRIVFVDYHGTFESAGPDSSTLAIVGIDGKGLRLLDDAPSGGGFDLQPDWSPTDDRIVYTSSGAAGVPQLYVVEPGQPARRLIDDADESAKGGAQPAWSADGKRVAFLRGQGVWIVDADGGDVRQLTTLPTASTDQTLTWSPDGKAVYAGGEDAHHSLPLRTIDVASGELTVAGSSGASLVWSADGGRLYGFTAAGERQSANLLTTVRVSGDGRLNDVNQVPSPTFYEDSSIDGLDATSCN